MSKRQLEKQILRDFMQTIEVNNAIKLENLMDENEVLKKQIARQKRDLIMKDLWIDGADEQYDRLLSDIADRAATVKPTAKLGLVRFHVGGVTEIADTRIKG